MIKIILRKIDKTQVLERMKATEMSDSKFVLQPIVITSFRL